MLNYVQYNECRDDKGLFVDLFQLRLFNDIVLIAAVVLRGTACKSVFFFVELETIKIALGETGQKRVSIGVVCHQALELGRHLRLIRDVT